MTVKQMVLTMLQAVPPPSDELVEALITQAQALVCGHLGQPLPPPGTDPAVAQLAIVLFNRLGAEGESRRQEGDIAISFDAVPESIKIMLKPWRKAKAVNSDLPF